MNILKTTLLAIMLIFSADSFAEVQQSQAPKNKNIVTETANPEAISYDNKAIPKAWAKVGRKGNIISCYRCNPTNSFRFAKGGYVIDFSPVGEDISKTLRIATLDLRHARDNDFVDVTIVVFTDSSDPKNSVIVNTALPSTQRFYDIPFNIMIY